MLEKRGGPRPIQIAASGALTRYDKKRRRGEYRRRVATRGVPPMVSHLALRDTLG